MYFLLSKLKLIVSVDVLISGWYVFCSFSKSFNVWAFAWGNDSMMLRNYKFLQKNAIKELFCGFNCGCLREPLLTVLTVTYFVVECLIIMFLVQI